MIVLDTEVLTELMRAEPNDAVVRWLDAYPLREIGTTAVSVSEVLTGLGTLPESQRKRDLLAVAGDIFDDYFAGRIHPFGPAEAVEYADVVAQRERLGRPISRANAQIAAICRTRGGTLATRAPEAFGDTGVDVVDPWEADPEG